MMSGKTNFSYISDVVDASNNNTSLQPNCPIDVLGPGQLTITIHVLTLLAGLLGNILLITAYVRIKEPIMFLIANMAASDLLVAIFLIPRLISRETIGSNAFLVHGNGGLFLCKICNFFSDISLSVSTESLVLIAVERFLAVVYPITYKIITVKTRRFLVASTWIISMAIHSPYFYIFRLLPDKDGNLTCWLSWEPAFETQSAHLRYSIFLYSTVLLIPLFVIAALYTRILFSLERNKMASYRSEKGARRIRKRNSNFKRMAIATITALLISWALYTVIAFLRLFSPGAIPNCNVGFKVVAYVSRVLASCYCAINPCICFIFIRDFSHELRSMCGCKRQQVAVVRRNKKRESTTRSSCQTSDFAQTVTARNLEDLVFFESNI